MTSSSPSPATGLTYSLAFIGGFSDAAGFVLAKTFTGHITGNLVLAAVSIATLDWGTTLIRLSAVLSFLAGILLSVAIARLAATHQWPLLVAAFVGEAALISAGSLMLSRTAIGAEIFVLCMSLALGLQNGAFRRSGGVSVHTTYLTGMLTGLMVSQAEKLLGPPRSAPAAHDAGTRLLHGIWFCFFLGAAIGAALVLRFREAGMSVVVLLLCVLIVRTLRRPTLVLGELPGS